MFARGGFNPEEILYLCVFRPTTVTLRLKEVANYWNAVLEMNDYRKKNFFESMFKSMNCNLKHKKLAIFGVSFKKDTNDARESPAIQICQSLLEEGAILNIYDPKTSVESVCVSIYCLVYQ